MTSDTSKPGSSGARLLRVMSAVVESTEPVSVRDLGRQLSLSPSTTHRLLNTLRAEGFVSYCGEDRVYSVGAKMYRLSARVLNQVSVLTLARGVAAEAAAQFDETILFGLYLPESQAMSFEVRIDGQKKLLYQIDLHTPLPLLWGASGKSILAHLPADVISSVLKDDGPSPAGSQRPPTQKQLHEELEAIRESGCSTTDSEKLPGARGIAAPVFDAGGVIGSLCMTVPRERLPVRSLKKISQSIVGYASQLSHQLGASPCEE